MNRPERYRLARSESTTETDEGALAPIEEYRERSLGGDVNALPPERESMADSEQRMESLMLVDSPEFERIMECVFGVQPHETRTYFRLLELPGSTVEELASALERDRSNVNRSLSTLREKELVERERRLLDGGGYVYQYIAVPVPDAQAVMHEAVDEWAETVHGRIDEFGP